MSIFKNNWLCLIDVVSDTEKQLNLRHEFYFDKRLMWKSVLDINGIVGYTQNMSVFLQIGRIGVCF